jgi:hypothetical protein
MKVPLNLVALALLAAGADVFCGLHAHAAGPSQWSEAITNLGPLFRHSSDAKAASKIKNTAELGSNSAKLEEDSMAAVADAYRNRGRMSNPAADVGEAHSSTAAVRAAGRAERDRDRDLDGTKASAGKRLRSSGWDFGALAMVAITIVGLLYLSGVLRFVKRAQQSRDLQT